MKKMIYVELAVLLLLVIGAALAAVGSPGLPLHRIHRTRSPA